MDAFASPSTHGASSGYKITGLVETALLALALGLSLMALPGLPDAKLDGSWQEMLILAHAQGTQFGRDLIFTWGPWGFLNSRFHLGSLEAVPMLAWQTLGQVLIAFALVGLTRRLPRWRRIAFVACILAVHWLFLDVVYFVLIALIGLAALMRRGTSVLSLLGWTLVLGFLSQFKFTYFAVAGVAVAASVVFWARSGSWPKALGVAGGFSLAVVAAWVAAGQNPDNLYPYIRRSIDIATGYGDAMGTDESWPLFLWGALLASLCLVFVWRLWRTLSDRPLALSAALFLGFTFFAMWKESYTRADLVPLGGHVFGIFTLVIILAPVLPGLLLPEERWHWFDLMLPFCAIAVACFDGAYYTLAPRIAWERIYGNMQALSRLGRVPDEWQAQYEQVRRQAALPAITTAVGSGSVDVYDFDLGVAILNGWRLASRPVFQGYSAYTPSLEGWNLRFYQSDRAPEFLLWNSDAIDGRCPGQDDARLLVGLPGHYEALFPEGGYWLFKKKSPLSQAPLEKETLLTRRVGLSQEIELPLERDHALWLEADAVPNALGRMRALAYKPAALNLTTTDDHGRTFVWRLVPRTAKTGFILVPMLAAGSDMVSLMQGEATSWVRSFRFEAPAGQEEFWSHVDVGVYRLPALPARAAAPIPWFVELGILDRPAISISSVAPQQVIDVPEGRALLLHAEGELVLEVPAGATQLSFGFGLREGAYTGEGHTDGVAFDVDGIWASGRRQHLWGRYLDPVSHAGDRGTQRADVSLPGDGPVRLILHTGPGPRNDNRWDWSYVSAVHFVGAQGQPRP